jgi:hypothetical protein
MSPDPITGTAQKCGFCLASPVIKSYDAAPILTRFAGELVLISQTKWPACADCAALINSDRWTELEDRAVEASIQRLRVDGTQVGYGHEQYVRNEIRHLHECIREAMRGTA